MRIAFYIILILTSLVSCQSVEKDTPKGKLYTEVMDIHDEAMPLMGDINKQMKAIKKKRKNNLDTETDRQAANQIKSLEEAEDAMMDWMANFDKSKMKNDEEAMIYLADQKIIISIVNKEMHKALADAKDFVQTLTIN